MKQGPLTGRGMGPCNQDITDLPQNSASFFPCFLRRGGGRGMGQGMAFRGRGFFQGQGRNNGL
jgi:hypothetical protein